MALAKPTTKKRPEPTIALINVVFLMLIFFMIAGALAPSLDDEVTLISSTDLDGRAPPDAVVLHTDGRMEYRGVSIDPLGIVELTQSQNGEGSVRLVVDRDLPASVLMDRVASIRDAGAEEIWLVTERGL